VATAVDEKKLGEQAETADRCDALMEGAQCGRRLSGSMRVFSL